MSIDGPVIAPTLDPSASPSNGGYAQTSTPQSDPDYYKKLRAQTGLGQPLYIQEQTRKDLLGQQAGLAGQFADQSQQSYSAYGSQGNDSLAALRDIAQGRNSVSAEQLRQAQQQNLAAQMAMSQGGPANNRAMMARNAAMQMGRSNVGMAGQQAMAGLQERNQAWQQYGGLLGTLRGQDLNAINAARGSALSGYGAAPWSPPGKDWIEQYGPAIAAGVAAASDRRLKTGIRSGEDAANKAASKIPAFIYKYKDERHGKGQQFGPMAQDLEKAGLGHAVVNTPAGKMVHGAKLALGNTAMIAAMARRLDKLEGGSEK